MEDDNKNEALDDNKNNGLNINDLGSMDSEKIKQMEGSKYDYKKLLIIGGITILILVLIIIIIILTSRKSSKSNDSDSEEEVNADIICIYNIEKINTKIQILGKEFDKTLDINVYIDGKKLNEVLKEYSFQKYGEHKVSYEINGEEINMDYMFKDVSCLINVQMNSIKNIKIKSMKSTFENCENLRIVNIKGFNTTELSSMEKIFYNSNIENINLDIDTNNIEDISFMFAGTNINEDFLIDLNLKTHNAKNMSYMFYKCNNLIRFNFSKLDLSNVEDISHMLDSCESMTEVYSLDTNTK